MDAQTVLAEYLRRVIPGQLATHQINKGGEGIQGRRAPGHHFQAALLVALVGLVVERAFVPGHPQYGIAACLGALRVTARVVITGAFEQRHQGRQLVGFQLFQRAAKVELSAQAHAVDGAVAVLAQVHLVQIGLENLLLAVMQLEQHRHRHFHQLARQGAILGEPEILHQLLGQGAAALDQAAGLDVGDHGAGQAAG